MNDGSARLPVVLFGAFDRHNFGDLLFPHIAAALIPTLMPGRDLVFAGLAERDLRCFGGHAVRALAQLGLDRADHPCWLVHVGGEILTCAAWQAAVMLLPPEQVQPTIVYLEGRPQEQLAFVHSLLGTDALAPYAVPRRRYAGLRGVIYCGVGGTALDRAEPALRAEVLANLGEADAVGVRDAQTLAHLSDAGIAARLMPDPAVIVAELFGARIGASAREGEVAEVLRLFPQGYLAVQFSADFGNDDSLAQIAAQLARVAARDGLGIVLFRAGAAPWHDDLAALRRVAERLPPGLARLFTSLDLWDICALIAQSRGYAGSSLHGRIVAAAFALPGVTLRSPAGAGGPGKQAAFASTWDETGLPVELGLCELAAGLHAALAVPTSRLRQQAERWAALYRRAFTALCLGLT